MFRSEIKAPGPKVTSIKLNKLQQCQKALIKILGTMPITILRILHEQSHPNPIIPSPTAGELLTHGWWHHGWLMERRCGDGGDDYLQFPVRQGARTKTSDTDFRF